MGRPVSHSMQGYRELADRPPPIGVEINWSYFGWWGQDRAPVNGDEHRAALAARSDQFAYLTDVLTKIVDGLSDLVNGLGGP